ncbi:biotin-dependent carboxyltransferase family protein [Phaeovulum sp.]|uniref:5-oxoprolinase subunit C family protein n=1 Tax=Phaeovulum sp. TaxID=2934796 RepID=UPI0039E6170F
MTEARFRVISAGPHVSVQDAGRFGHMRFGVPASGPMDRTAHAIANTALACPPEAAAIEISLGGLVLECLSGALSVAVAGGGFIVDVGETRSGAWTVHTVRAGQRLAVRRGPWGSWAYLAFAGVLVAHNWLGHAATHSMSGLGGGRLLPGQELVVTNTRVVTHEAVTIPCPVFARPLHRIRIVMGPQDHFFDAAAQTSLLYEPFSMTPAYDRMGVRLSGPPLSPVGALSIPSEPILRGSIQVTGDGVATILLADHQTTGGYPKIATIVSSELDGLVQLRARDQLRFIAIPPPEAVHRARHHAAKLRQYLATLAAAPLG